MTEQENIKIFFSNTVFKISKIEKMAGIPNRSLYDFLKGGKYRHLSKSKLEKLIPVLEKLGYKKVN